MLCQGDYKPDSPEAGGGGWESRQVRPEERLAQMAGTVCRGAGRRGAAGLARRRGRWLAGAGFGLNLTFFHCGWPAAACRGTHRASPAELSHHHPRAPCSRDHVCTSHPHTAGALRHDAKPVRL